MKRFNLRLGCIAGTPIILALDWLVFVLGFTLMTLITSGTTYAANTFLAIMAISVIVVLHELGHMFAAKRFGARTNSISLHCFGGLAAINLNDWPKLLNRPWQSLLVWLAGPMVNIGLFGILTLLSPLFGSNPTVVADLNYLKLVNVSLAIFNLLPVFPLDGGGILLSLLRMVFSKQMAIKITSIVGVIGSIGFILLALKLHGYMLGTLGVITLLTCLQVPKHPLYR